MAPNIHPHVTILIIIAERIFGAVEDWLQRHVSVGDEKGENGLSSSWSMPLGSKRRKLSDTCKERSSLEQMKVDVSRLEADKEKLVPN
jgi:hypothetical protein